MAIDPSKFKIDPKKASEADLARALEMLEKENYRKARIKAGEIKGSRSWAEMTDEQKQERRDYNTKHRAERNVIIQKAIASGITATDAEIVAEIERMRLAAAS